ncbi:uncharacterized protein PG986_012369 [Apiospora aurea]|uniref:Uncharacterized protein n=1 Tax=Apiospora aurea TaxID=335848 RepID=A0ABR1PZS6_9PEZI
MANPTPLTIGAEAEGILGSGGCTTGKGESSDSDSSDSEFDISVQEWMFQEIRRTLANNVGVYVNGLDDGAKVNVQSIHMAGGTPLYYGWRVVEESTAKIPIDETRHYHPQVKYPSLELLTPAMEFCQKSLDEIRAVYRCLTITETPGFRPGPLTPTTCGYHVHVGIGAERFSAHQTRRIACVTYATGRLLTQLLPNHRKGNLHARTNCYYSFLAHGQSAHWACEQVRIQAQSQDPEGNDANFGTNGGMEETPLLVPAETYVPSGPLEFSWEKKEDEEKSKGKEVTDASGDVEMQEVPRFTRKLPRGSLPREDLNPEGFFYTSPQQVLLSDINLVPSRFEGAGSSPTSIADAVDVVMRCPSAAAVAQLLRPGRLGVSFSNLATPVREFMPEKPTIEFRQLPATFNADAACAWIGIVAQLCRVAIDWPWEDVAVLLRRCARADAEPDAHDVFDLLVDIGCAEQAAVIQDMVIDGPVGSPFARLNEPDHGAQQPGTGGASPPSNTAGDGNGTESRPFEINLP